MQTKNIYHPMQDFLKQELLGIVPLNFLCPSMQSSIERAVNLSALISYDCHRLLQYLKELWYNNIEHQHPVNLIG